MELKIVLALACVGCALAAGPPYHPAPYAPAPYHPVEKIPPKPFAYEYGVKDEYSGANFGQNEVQDEYGTVSGEYRVLLPDGRTQIVTYHADHENGYTADVKYEGVPHYEPAPYHPKPAPYHPAPYHPKPAPYAPAPVYHPSPAPYH